MNRAHAKVADWGMQYLPQTEIAEIAELGCGGGRNVRALLQRYPTAKVTALNYSEISVEKTGQVNRREIQKDAAALCRGCVQITF